MNRSARTWIIFTLCIALGMVAMIWITHATLDMEGSELRVRREAVMEEKVRLALWRMDSALAPLIIQESGRPYFQFTAFYPADRAYSRMFVDPESNEALIPSPLLFVDNPYVLLHFQIDPEGRFSSPQIPKEIYKNLAKKAHVAPEQIKTAKARLTELMIFLQRDSLLAQLSDHELQFQETTGQLEIAEATKLSADQTLDQKASKVIVQKSKESLNTVTQSTLNAQEYEARAKQQSTYNRFPKASEQLWSSQSIQDSKIVQEPVEKPSEAFRKPTLASNKAQKIAPRSASNVWEGPIRPLWFGASLVLTRRVRIDNQDFVQGCWLDWSGIKGRLRSTIADLLPDADFVPTSQNDTPEAGRLMAALPVRMIPGPITSGIQGSQFSPIRLSLFFAWCCAIIASASGAIVLKSAVQLSERRGAFVSAVTHELRTPLTTFRLYTEMLVLDMVQDEAEKKSFLNTLMAEADRLDHLVKNVLAYARLESKRSHAQMGTISLGSLLDRYQERLVQRAEQAAMPLLVDPPEEMRDLIVRTDPSVVEQILFNLVDNACKYASSAKDKTIHVEINHHGREATLLVQDHGPGIGLPERRRLFQPFSKSAQDAAHSAPGIGLGLALSRNLARSLGGDLEYVPAPKGACFKLKLPLA